MRRLTPALCLTILMVVFSAAAAGEFGLGIMAGEPTGLSLKGWLSDAGAVDAALGWSVGDEDWFYLHADYLRHGFDMDVQDVDEGTFYYYGIGARVLLREGHESKLGARVPVGLCYFFEDQNIDVFIELAPVFNLIPETTLGLSGGIGARFWF
ncbi:MAG: hypothetical protein JXB46_06585 [Candidatus Eisenbacteria bacterium]|nr:hypothetical protein [Candidatus Eisenbacteria bacterium]